jgi:hypothetical protein
MTDSHKRTIRVATYNIHRCRGLDGRTLPARIADVIRASSPSRKSSAPAHIQPAMPKNWEPCWAWAG